MFAPKVAKPLTKPSESSLNNLLVSQRTWSPAARFDDASAQEIERPQILARTAAPGLSWNFGKIPLFPPERRGRPPGSSSRPGIIQTKLVVGRTNDPLEHEADLVADPGMRTPGSHAATSAVGSQVSRSCAA